MIFTDWVREQKLKSKPDFLQPDIILKQLGQSLFARNMVFHQSLNSTNSLAKELASTGAPEGSIVLAEEQTSGRGRMGRRWVSPGCMNLLFSLLLRPALHPDQVFVLTMILALATVEVIQKATGLRSMIKWPNDIYVERKKLAGILTEFSLREREIDYVVLGLGINVNWSPGNEEELLNPATSILAETGLKTSRNGLLIEILKLFENYYRKVLEGETEEFYKKWNELSMIMGREVEIESESGKIRGKAIKIDHQGALIIEDNRGTEQKILCGDVSIKV